MIGLIIRGCLPSLFLILLTSSGYAATLYVSPSGSGSSCTSGSPCSISTAQSQSNSGDTIMFKDGTYNRSSSLTTNKNGVTYQAENRWQAIIRATTDIIQLFYVDHTNTVVNGLRVNGNNVCCQGDPVFRVRNGSNVIIEYVYVENAFHAGFSATSTNGLIVRHSRFDDTGSECMYLGGGGTNSPNFNMTFYNNHYTDCGSNSIDWRTPNDGANFHHNLAELQVGKGLQANDGVINWTGRNGDFHDNIVRNNQSNSTQNYVGGINQDIRKNVYYGNDVAYALRDKNSPYKNTLADTNIFDNTWCGETDAIRDNEGYISGGTANVFNNAGLPGDVAQSNCDAEVDRIIGKPTMASCNIGTVNDTTVSVNIQTNTHPPVSSVGSLQVTYDGAGQTENSVVLFSSQQARITMASAPSSQSVVVRVIAAAGDIENSAFIGGTLNGKNNAQTLTCTNTISGGDPPPPPPPVENLRQETWRFGAIHRAEGVAWVAPVNQAITAYPGDRFRWRVAIQGGGQDAPSRGYALFARVCPATPPCNAWERVTSTFGTLGVRFHDDQINTMGMNTTNQLPLAGGYSFVSGYFIDSPGAVPSIPIGTTQQVEWEFALQLSRDDTVAGDTLELRMHHDDTTELAEYVVGVVNIGRGRHMVSGVVGGNR